MSSFLLWPRIIKASWAAHGSIAQSQVYFCLCPKKKQTATEVEVKYACICMCQAAHQASAYSSFCSMNRLEVFLLPPGWDVSPSQGYPQHLICQYLFIHLSGYWGTARVKCLAQEQNTMFAARAGTQTARNRKEKQKSNNRSFTQTAYNFQNKIYNN